MEPCVASPPRKCHRLTAPAKPLPLLMPVTSTNSPGLKRSTRTRSPALVSSAESSSRTSRKRRIGAASDFLKCPIMGFVTRCGLIKSTRPRLPGVVAVLPLGAPLHHHAGACLQHRTADRHTIVGEDLGHAQLDS